MNGERSEYGFPRRVRLPASERELDRILRAAEAMHDMFEDCPDRGRGCAVHQGKKVISWT